MQIKSICNRNIGPTERVNINFYQNSDNTPKPVVLVGENGSGKSTVLSNIAVSYTHLHFPRSSVREFFYLLRARMPVQCRNLFGIRV